MEYLFRGVLIHTHRWLLCIEDDVSGHLAYVDICRIIYLGVRFSENYTVFISGE